MKQMQRMLCSPTAVFTKTKTERKVNCSRPALDPEQKFPKVKMSIYWNYPDLKSINQWKGCKGFSSGCSLNFQNTWHGPQENKFQTLQMCVTLHEQSTPREVSFLLLPWRKNQSEIHKAHRGLFYSCGVPSCSSISSLFKFCEWLLKNRTDATRPKSFWKLIHYYIIVSNSHATLLTLSL